MSALFLFGLKWVLGPAVPFYYAYAWLLRYTALSGDVASAIASPSSPAFAAA